MVDIVQQVDDIAELAAEVGHHLRREVEVRAGFPGVLLRDVTAGRLVDQTICRRDAVGLRQARDGCLGTDREIPLVHMPLEVCTQLVQCRPAGVAVNQNPVAGSTPEQLVHRKPSDLSLDVPQRDIDRRDCGHRDRSAPPIGAPVEVLPGVLDPARIAADEQWADVIP